MDNGPHPETVTASVSRCQWPQGCVRAVKPTGAARGPQWTKYCQHAEPGQPIHNGANAWALKRDSHTDRQPVPADDRRPVTTAVTTASSVIERVEVVTGSLRELVELLVEALRTASDPDAAAAQIEAAIADAQQETSQARAHAARETAARIHAEHARDEALAAADDMAAQNTAAETARQAAHNETETARAHLASITSERDALTEQLHQAQRRIHETQMAHAVAVQHATDAEHATAAAHTAREHAETTTHEAREHAADAQRRAERAEATAEQLHARLTDTQQQLHQAHTDRDRHRHEHTQIHAELTATRQRADRLADHLAAHPTTGKK